MAHSNLPVLSVSGHIGCPVKQGQVQQAVNDQAVVVLRSQRPPCLDETALFLKTADKLFGCHDSSLLCPLVSRKLIGCHTGRCI